MKEDLISIIIPIYNVEKYLKKCIDSIINQTYKDIEIILVDDGSTDNCGKIIDEYQLKDKRIKTIHKKNGGLSDARNAGIEEATGQYFAFIDSDDFVDERMIEILYKNIKREDAELSICNIYKFYDENIIVSTQEEEKIEVLSPIDVYKRMSSNSYYVVAWNKLYKREIFETLRYPIGKVNEDTAIIHYILDKCNKIVCSNLELYYYRQREGSITNRPNINLLDGLEFVYDSILFFEKRGFSNEKFYNERINSYYAALYQRYELFHKNGIHKFGIYKKYFKILKELLGKYKFKSKREKILRYFFLKFPYVYMKSRDMMKIKSKILINYKQNKFNRKITRAYKAYLKNTANKEKYLLFNTPSYGNLGDHAIAMAERKILKDNNINYFEIPSDNVLYFIKKFKSTINKKDIIMITGGGYFGSLWKIQETVNELMSNFNNNEIIVLPQTIYYSKDISGLLQLYRDKSIYEKCNNLTIFSRDKATFDFCKNNFKKAKIVEVPDMVVYLRCISNAPRDKKILICLREDRERIIDIDKEKELFELLNKSFTGYEIEKFSTLTNESFLSEEEWNNRLNNLIKKISSSSLVITDRLHGMLLSTITSTPCIALNNKSGKVKGMYDWISKDNDYIKFIDNIKNISKAIEKMDINKRYSYNNKNLKYELENNIINNCLR